MLSTTLYADVKSRAALYCCSGTSEIRAKIDATTSSFRKPPIGNKQTKLIYHWDQCSASVGGGSHTVKDFPA